MERADRDVTLTNLSPSTPSAETLPASQKTEFSRRVEAWREKNVPSATASPAAPPRRRHISEAIREIMSDVPPEIMADLPKDGASQHDHYIYGTPDQTNSGR